MEVNVFSNYESLCAEVGKVIIQYIRQKPEAVICLASGHTPIGVFNYLVKEVKAGSADISSCTFVGLDEWLGIAASNPGSCRFLMNEFWFKPLQIPEPRIVFFDGMTADPHADVSRVNQFIDNHRGLDIMLAGIGLNGHLAMNEPGTPFHAKAHISLLAEETKHTGQKYFSEATPLTKGITLGLQHFRDARLPILMANGKAKACIMKRALTVVPTEQLPASVVQLMPHAKVMLDEEAAQEWNRHQWVQSGKSFL